jgi:hypothetical protein
LTGQTSRTADMETRTQHDPFRRPPVTALIFAPHPNEGVTAPYPVRHQHRPSARIDHTDRRRVALTSSEPYRRDSFLRSCHIVGSAMRRERPPSRSLHRTEHRLPPSLPPPSRCCSNFPTANGRSSQPYPACLRASRGPSAADLHPSALPQ